MKPKTFSDLFEEAERHDDYWVTGAILDFTEGVVKEMERQGLTRTELAQRLGTSPAYVTKILRGKGNFTLETMVRLARALGTELRVQLAVRAAPAARRAPGKPGAATRIADRTTKVAAAGEKVAAKRVRAPGSGSRARGPVISRTAG